MKIKLDENLSRRLKTHLNQLGHDALTAAEESHLSQPDEVIAAAAKREGRMVFTLDVEFTNLRKNPPGMHPGIILFRPQDWDRLKSIRSSRNSLLHRRLEVFSECLVVVELGRIRVRRPSPKGWIRLLEV